MAENSLRIISLRKAVDGSVRLSPGEKAFFLDDDSEALLLVKKINVATGLLVSFEGLFNREMTRLRSNIVEAFAGLNLKNSSFAWWGSHVSSKSTSAVPFVRLAVYYYCAIKLLAEHSGALVFIVDSHVLARMIGQAAQDRGWQVRLFFLPGWIAGKVVRLYGCVIRVRQICGYIYKVFCRKFYARQFLSHVRLNREGQRNVLIRTWVTAGSFNAEGRVVERNFGLLADQLATKGCAVFHSPMFFNLNRPLAQVYAALFHDWKGGCLIPEHYLTWGDYFRCVVDAFSVSMLTRFEFLLGEDDFGDLLNEVLVKQGIDSDLCVLNLGAVMLTRLSERGVAFERIIYPFECNASENQFILAARKHYPQARIIGYQHTVFFDHQFSYHLAADEFRQRPLPDVLICSGKKYVELLEMAGFPAKMLRLGPNLRFGKMNASFKGAVDRVDVPEAVLVPLSFSYSLAMDVFIKIQQAFHGSGVKIYLRSHPLLSRRVLKRMADKAGLLDVQFADQGSLQDWLLRVRAVVTSGASVTTLEAVVAGIPVIRVVPDAAIHFDALHEADYFFSCVSSEEDLRSVYDRTGSLFSEDSDSVVMAAQRVRELYFSRDREEQCCVFLDN